MKKIISTKYEILNNTKALMPKTQNGMAFWYLNLEFLNLFRA